MKYCSKCGKQVHEEAIICIGCGCSLEHKPSGILQKGEKEKTTTLLLALFLGVIGAHKFYIGNNKSGIFYLIIGLLTGFLVSGILTLIDIIKILCNSELDRVKLV